MIFTTGDIFTSGAEALVNAVNCEGVMGKGLALEFKRRYPDAYQSYRAACLSGSLRIGTLHGYEYAAGHNPRYVINFPTKVYWREKSRVEYIETGLSALREVVISREIASVAVPALGCGLGGLDRAVVKSLIAKGLSGLDAEIIVFEPL